jgi:hypothetical protein
MAKRPDGRFLGLRGILSTADGELSVTGEDKINVASTSLSFALDEAGDRLAIPSGEIRTHTGYVTFEAAADLAELGHTTIVGNIRSGALSTPIGEKKSVPIIGGGGMARVKFADLGIEIERLLLVTPDGTASAIGQASLAGPTPGVSFALSMTELPAATVRALWPPFVADKVRLWFEINVKSGTLGPATLQVALPPDHIGARNRGKVLPRYALVGSLPFHDAEFSPISNLTPPRISWRNRASSRCPERASCKRQARGLSFQNSGGRSRGGTFIWSCPARRRRWLRFRIRRHFRWLATARSSPRI